MKRRSFLATAALASMAGCQLTKKFSIVNIESSKYIADISPAVYGGPASNDGQIRVTASSDIDTFPTAVTSLSPDGDPEGNNEFDPGEVEVIVDVHIVEGAHTLLVFESNNVVERIQYRLEVE